MRWHNVYKDEVSLGHHSAHYAAHFGTQVAEVDWLRVEERWNGHWLRPCVGMRAEQASHVWTLPSGSPYGSHVDIHYTAAMSLVRRT